jgi:LPS-assembly lipoprotein
MTTPPRPGIRAASLAGLRKSLGLPWGVAPALSMVLSVAGCGFQPLYGAGGTSRTTGASIPDQLRQVYVASIPERYGQELREYLQQNLSGAHAEDPTGYTLRVNSYVMDEAVDIHSDNTTGRTRASAHAHWTLYTVAVAPVLVTQGDAQAVDGENESFEQYFAQNLNQATLSRRVADTIAERITQQLAVWFRTHAKPAQRVVAPQPIYIDPNVMPDSNNGIPRQSVGEDGMPGVAIGRSSPNPSGDPETAPGNGTVNSQ